MEENIFYREFNSEQLRDYESKPQTAVNNEDLNSNTVVRTKRRFIQDSKLEVKHDSVRVNRDNHGKINVIVEAPLFDEGSHKFQ